VASSDGSGEAQQRIWSQATERLKQRIDRVRLAAPGDWWPVWASQHGAGERGWAGWRVVGVDGLGVWGG
jgi:hypothetical protein